MPRLLSLLHLLMLSVARLAAADQEWLSAKLEQLRVQHRLPGIAAAAVREEEIVISATAGLRKVGSPERVTLADKWHIGSCTKSMTATVAAILVEEGRIRWESTIAELFPEWRAKMAAQWRPVTLEQLLTHRSGAPEDAPPDIWADAQKEVGSPAQQRIRFVRALLEKQPVASPGSKHIYSNQGYAIAGAMLEKVTKKPWEELMQTRLFTPLRMTSAGFGPPASRGKIDQPWGHRAGQGKLEPVPRGPGADNPPAIGPAGTVHCSIADFARYAGWHARGVRGGQLLLSGNGFATLRRAPAGQAYAMGWGVAEREWGGGATFSHAGSNTMFYAIMWVAPEKNAAFVAATNAAGPEARAACDEAVSAMIARVLAK